MMFVRYFGIWLGVFLATLLIVKLPYRIADHIIYDRETSVSEFVKNILLATTSDGKTPTSGLPVGRQIPLLTQATGEEVEVAS